MGQTTAADVEGTLTGPLGISLAQTSLQLRNTKDVVLMDVQMQHMDGVEATRIIRNIEKSTGAHIPVIAITAHAMTGDRERCLDAGMDAYISKPIHAEELLKLVSQLGARNVVDSNQTLLDLA